MPLKSETPFIWCLDTSASCKPKIWKFCPENSSLFPVAKQLYPFIFQLSSKFIAFPLTHSLTWTHTCPLFTCSYSFTILFLWQVWAISRWLRHKTCLWWSFFQADLSETILGVFNVWQQHLFESIRLTRTIKNLPYTQLFE